MNGNCVPTLFRAELQCILRDLRDNGGGSILRGGTKLFYLMSHQVIFLYRIRRCLLLTGLAPLATLVRYLQNLLGGNDLSGHAIIGRFFRLPHPSGVIIGDGCRISDHVTIFQQVTIGTYGKLGGARGYPVLQDHVRVYAGAKIIGEMLIEENAMIGANAVLLTSVPAWHLAVGVPARVVPRRDAPPSAVVNQGEQE